MPSRILTIRAGRGTTPAQAMRSTASVEEARAKAAEFERQADAFETQAREARRLAELWHRHANERGAL